MTDGSSANIWEILPYEIVASILEHACTMSKQTCLALSLTSSWTRRFAHQLLYENVIIYTMEQLKSLHASCNNVYIKSLELRVDALHLRPGGKVVAPPEVVNIVKEAVNLQHLMVFIDFLPHLASALSGVAHSFGLKTVAVMSRSPSLNIFDTIFLMLSQLGVSLGVLPVWTQFTSVTHLEFHKCSTGLFDTLTREKLEHIMPNLTHLCWTFDISFQNDLLERAINEPGDLLYQGKCPQPHQIFAICMVGTTIEECRRTSEVWEKGIKALGWPKGSWFLMVDVNMPAKKGNIWARVKREMDEEGI